jgi:serine/threonine protein kinase
MSAMSAPGLAASFGVMCPECSQIVHRDVKAPNVLLREVESRWDVCIADFGTAACCLERARPWLQSCLAEAPFAAGT